MTINYWIGVSGLKLSDPNTFEVQRGMGIKAFEGRNLFCAVNFSNAFLQCSMFTNEVLPQHVNDVKISYPLGEGGHQIYLDFNSLQCPLPS